MGSTAIAGDARREDGIVFPGRSSDEDGSTMDSDISESSSIEEGAPNCRLSASLMLCSWSSCGVLKLSAA